jgi:hypothetical protein
MMKNFVWALAFAALCPTTAHAEIERQLFRGDSASSQQYACVTATERANRWVNTPRGTARGFKKQNTNSVGSCTCEANGQGSFRTWNCVVNATIDWAD